MVLTHYTDAPIKGLIRSSNGWLQLERKPTGLWVSVDGDEDWPWWLKENNYDIPPVEHRVTLSPDAEILRLRTAKELRQFNREFGDGKKWHTRVYWNEVGALYQGIIIAPHRAECRLDPYMYWYMAWDCASGCIWDASAIQSVRRMKDGRVRRRKGSGGLRRRAVHRGNQNPGLATRAG